MEPLNVTKVSEPLNITEVSEDITETCETLNVTEVSEDITETCETLNVTEVSEDITEACETLKRNVKLISDNIVKVSATEIQLDTMSKQGFNVKSSIDTLQAQKIAYEDFIRTMTVQINLLTVQATQVASEIKSA